MNSYSDSDKIQFEKVFGYKNSRHFSQGLKILKLLENRLKDDKIIIGLMATLYFEKKKYVYSAKYFRKSTILNPNSEVSSLGLFHSLIHLGKFSLAIKELKRFTTLNKYKLYKTTIKELKKNIANFNIKEQKLIKDIIVK